MKFVLDAPDHTHLLIFSEDMESWTTLIFLINTRVVPVNRGLYKYIKNLMSQNNKTFPRYQILYYTHNK